MPINTRNELTIDIEQSISKAYDSSLRGREAKDLREYLDFILPKIKDPNTLINPVRFALTAIDSKKRWHKKPIEILALGIIGSLIVAVIVF